jgi:hypothetical protein
MVLKKFNGGWRGLQYTTAQIINMHMTGKKIKTEHVQRKEKEANKQIAGSLEIANGFYFRADTAADGGKGVHTSLCAGQSFFCSSDQ